MSVADHVIKKCGGAVITAELAGCSVNWVYRWRLPKEKGGTGGKVPAEAMDSLIRAAHEGRCTITPNDFFEETMPVAAE